jgi:hypothetical protein
MADDNSPEEKPDEGVPVPVAENATEKPAFRSRAKSPEDDEEDPAEKKRKQNPAAFRATPRKDDEERDDARIINYDRTKPGFSAFPKKEPPSGDDFPRLKGEGWIYCGKDAKGRSTYIQDRGDEIYVPIFKTTGASEGQRAKIYELAQKKGWGPLGVFKNDGRTIPHKDILASLALPRDPKARSLGECREHAQTLHEMMQENIRDIAGTEPARRNVAPAPAPA